MLIAHKTRIHCNNRQIGFFKTCISAKRIAYNWALGEAERAWKEEKIRLSASDIDKRFNAMKRTEFEWMYTVPSCVAQQAITANYKRAMQNFFRRLKTGDKEKGFPRHKIMKKETSFVFTNVVCKDGHLVNGKLKLPKNQGTCRLGSMPRYKGRLMSTTISRTGHKWYVSFLFELDKPPEYSVATGKPIGLDAGVKNKVTTSDGRKFRSPESLKTIQKMRARAQRKLARMQCPNYKIGQKASKAWLKQKQKVSRFETSAANVRRDSNHQISAVLARDHEVVVMEDLQLKNMTKSAKGTAEKPGKKVKQKSGLNRSILEQSIGQLKTFMAYKTERHKGIFATVNPAYTSQKCRKCGHISKENRTSQAKFLCVKCGHAENADINAAKNILDLYEPSEKTKKSGPG